MAGMVALAAAATIPQVTQGVQGAMCKAEFYLVIAAHSDGTEATLAEIPDACLAQL